MSVMPVGETSLTLPASSARVDLEPQGRVGSRRWVWALVAVLAAVPVGQLVWGTWNYYLHFLLYLFMYVAMASNWNILGGYTGYVSLGHNVFFAVGGYLSALLLVHLGWSPFWTASLAGAACALLGLVAGLISLRVRGPAFIITTIALMGIMQELFDNWEFIGGSNGMSVPMIPLGPRYTKIPFYYAMLALAVASVYVSYRIRHSRFGLGLRAIAQDEAKAEAAGIHTTAYKVAAFALSTVFVGMAGALWAYQLTYLRPTAFFNILISANLVLMCVIGGRGTVAGPVIGAVVMVLVQELFVALAGGSELNLVASGLILLLTLWFFPNGIVGSLKAKNRLPAWLDW